MNEKLIAEFALNDGYTIQVKAGSRKVGRYWYGYREVDRSREYTKVNFTTSQQAIAFVESSTLIDLNDSGDALIVKWKFES